MIGQPQTCPIGAQPPAAAADQDLTGDGTADLLTIGAGTTGTASGLWVADGQAGSSGQFDGTIDTTATDIAPYGPQGTGTPASWNGMDAITGQFNGAGFNAIEAWYPGGDGGDAPGIYLISTQGDGTAVTSPTAFTGQESSVENSFDITPYIDAHGDQPDPTASGYSLFPLQLADAYNVSGSDQQVPDEIGIYNDPADEAYLSPITGQSSFLAYFQSNGSPGDFDSSNNSGVPYILTNPSPDGSPWSDWTITTAAAPGGGATMYLWNQSEGKLYEWPLAGTTGLGTAANPGSGNVNPSATLQGTPVQVTVPWTTGTAVTSLQATSINGQPALMDVTSTGQVQSWTLNGTTFTQANSTGPAQKLSTADHTYLLDEDATDGDPVTTAADQPGATATGTDPEYDLGQSAEASKPTWTDGDSMFSPDITFNGSDGQYLSTGPGDADFTPNGTTGFAVSAWVNPTAINGGTVFSQDGSSYSSLTVSASPATDEWNLSLSEGGDTYDVVSGGTVNLGLWTDLVLTFDGANGDDVYKLYANGVEVDYLQDTTPPSGTGSFLLGARQDDGSPSSFLSGQVADVQVWDNLAVPVQPATAPGAYVPVTPVRILDTRSGSGIGGVTGPVASDTAINVPIEGTTVSGANVPSSDVTAADVSPIPLARPCPSPRP
jgi:hypothetical protein